MHFPEGLENTPFKWRAFASHTLQARQAIQAILPPPAPSNEGPEYCRLLWRDDDAEAYKRR